MVTLHDYQQSAFRKILEAFVTQIAVLIVMATGLGKTLVSAFFANIEFKKKKIGLFLCHENDILDQAFSEYRQVLGEEAVLRKFYGSDKDWNADKADVLFASFQSFKEWHRFFDADHFDYIIVDESHHGQAPTYKEVITYFKPEKLLGMTATPDREDEKDIREIFGPEVVNYTLEEALAKGWLTQVEYHIMNDGINTQRLNKVLKDVLEEGQRISVKQLNETIFVHKRDEVIAREINEVAQHKKTIIFCENIEHAESFSKHLESAVVFHSKASRGKNKQNLQDFRDGKVNYILAVNKFNEGIDVPDVEVIVFLRNTDSKRIFLQQLGRGLRKLINKEKVVILDFVANCERLMYLAEVGKMVKELSGGQFNLTKDNLRVSGECFDFIFSDVQIDIFNILNRLKAERYATWQEASAAAIKLGIRSSTEYFLKYYLDPKLPRYPRSTYQDFPGYGVFLGTGHTHRKRHTANYYPTWQEASKAAIALNFSTSDEYKAGYYVDPRLPATPQVVYKNFPGFAKFLDKELYETVEEASRAAIQLGIKTQREYKKKYSQDPKLPAAPWTYYDNFSGFGKYLGTGKEGKKW